MEITRNCAKSRWLTPGQFDLVAQFFQFRLQNLALVALYFDVVAAGTAAHATAFLEFLGEVAQRRLRQGKTADDSNRFPSAPFGFPANPDDAITDCRGPVLAADAVRLGSLTLGTESATVGRVNKAV